MQPTPRVRCRAGSRWCDRREPALRRPDRSRPTRLSNATHQRIRIDEGCRFTPCVVQHEALFDPFFTTKEVDEGTGLGLAGVHAITTSLGGSVEVRSEPGHGTTFAVIIPLTGTTLLDPTSGSVSGSASQSPPAGAVVAHPARPADVAHDNPSGTILIVDDEPALVAVFSRALRRQGYEVVTAGDAYHALEVFQLDPLAVALLITDLSMPQMTGAELISECRAMRPDLPAILMSSFADERWTDLDALDAHGDLGDDGDHDTDEHSAEANALQFLQKPFGIDDLLAAVGTVVSIRREGHTLSGAL